MDLSWSPRLSENLIANIPEHRRDRLEELYPDGLSTHGAKHALLEQGAYRVKNQQGMPADLLEGKISAYDEVANEDTTYWQRPLLTQSEYQLELVRRFEFPEKISRFQSYYASETLEEAEMFRVNLSNPNSSITRIECSSFEKRDMDCVGGQTFEEVLDGCSAYWNCEFVADDSTAEVVIEPPVEVTEVVDSVE